MNYLDNIDSIYAGREYEGGEEDANNESKNTSRESPYIRNSKRKKGIVKYSENPNAQDKEQVCVLNQSPTF